MATRNVLKLKIRDSENIIFEGEVDRVSSYNEEGPFDLYPMHANFISILEKEVSIYHQNKKIKQIDIEKAVLKVKADLVHIFLGIESLSLTNTPFDDKSKNDQDTSSK